MKKLAVGILAHVDAGKTTLSEALLYHCGQIRHLGRVDHKDTFLDHHDLERERGITIFSKQALLKTDRTVITLLDTPGHVDFSSEMERTLQVMDYAVLLISAPDGIQGHTVTLYRLLERYRIPVFVFVNKMDQPGTDPDRLMAELTDRFGLECVDFSAASEFLAMQAQDTPSARVLAFMENAASCEESVLEQYLESERITAEQIAAMIRKRLLFPCYFGSALKLEGIAGLLEGLEAFTAAEASSGPFAARVFKLSRDENGTRLAYAKVLSGSLKVRSLVAGHSGASEWEDKVDQIRIYSGSRFETAEEIFCGDVAALTGLSQARPGDGLGAAPSAPLPVLAPVLDYRLVLPAGTDPHIMLGRLRELAEEDPQLHIRWEERTGEIHIMLMGEVQLQVLRTLILERFGTEVDFDAGSVVYKETIAAPSIGVGHFEPLRHYAEVHLLLEPGQRGSGLVLDTACSEDVLDRNWQRLILTHLAEREHPGVLGGFPITDIRITLISGRAHLKHTEGGDFRQAVYRAVRNGLRKAPCILLEPVYSFRIELPVELAGRAMTDVSQMGGEFTPPADHEDGVMLTGTAPVSAMRDYPRRLAAYSGGRGRIFLQPGGYAPCSGQEEILAGIGYDPEADTDNPTGSVFCSHGAGVIVPWDQVEAYMHVQDDARILERVRSFGNSGAANAVSGISENMDKGNRVQGSGGTKGSGAEREGVSFRDGGYGSYAQEKELMQIFERTYGEIRRRWHPSSEISAGQEHKAGAPGPDPCAEDGQGAVPRRRKKQDGQSYLLVDGYNIIFGWEDLAELAKTDIHAAQSRLMDILSNYQGMTGCELILVFDAYKVPGHAEEVVRYHNIYVVYTREAETADMYIEKTVHQLGRKHQVTVATSDGLEQIIILGQGAARLSARGLRQAIDEAESTMRAALEDMSGSRSTLLDNVDPGTARWIEEQRRKET